MKVSAVLASPEASLFGLQMATFSLPWLFLNIVLVSLCPHFLF